LTSKRRARILEEEEAAAMPCRATEETLLSSRGLGPGPGTLAGAVQDADKRRGGD